MNYSSSVQNLMARQHLSTLGTFTIDGVPVMKNAVDIVIYWQIVEKTKPDTIVEIGSRFGGSAMMFARLQEICDVRSTVISVDIDMRQISTFASGLGIYFVEGDSLDLGVFGRVKSACDEYGEKVMVVHDGQHAAEHVLADLKLYHQLVTVGQYLVVEDTIMDVFPGAPIRQTPGPLAGVDRFLEWMQGAEQLFLRDKTFENLYQTTYNPGGFLQRVS